MELTDKQKATMLKKACRALMRYLMITFGCDATINIRPDEKICVLERYYMDGFFRNNHLHGIGKKTLALMETEFSGNKYGGKTMTEKEYNQAEGVRRSDLWKMEDSPEKYAYFLEHPVEQTPAMAFGSACHKMILEPADFGNEYAVAPEINRRTNAGKAEWEAFCAENEGKTIVTQEDANTMAEMEAALENCSLANDLIRGEGETEVAFFWTDAETGEKCKVKLDRLIVGEDGRYYVVDYKTCLSAQTDRFNHEVFKLGYYMQAAMYTEAVMVCKKLDYRPTFLFVAQEKKAPYSLNVIEVSDDVMKVGVAKFHELLGKLHDCKEVDIYPGYVDDVPNETQLPGWWSLEGEEE